MNALVVTDFLVEYLIEREHENLQPLPDLGEMFKLKDNEDQFKLNIP